KADRAMSERCNTLGAAAKRAFVKTFWSDELGRLIDHVTPEGERDLSLRPNMILACSLEHSPLALPKRKAVIAEVREKLLTPVGLRTLPDDDPAYHPGYGGPQFDRDRAYHQGTVWPWLLGPYAEAVLRAGKFGRKAKAEAAGVMRPLLDRLTGEGLGQLAEIHDAASPHAARGCPAQAWSVAEALRVRVLLAG
ncbi:MAG: amylo-alpha-1,6-glucosidase, partial [Planctomycetota bacterium]